MPLSRLKKASISVILLAPVHAWAFLDFLGEQAKEVLQVAAYADAAASLMSEVSGDEEVQEGSSDLRRRADTLRTQAYDIKSLSYSTNSVLNGPDWTSKRLDSNIRATTNYVRRLKSMLTKVYVLGTTGITALNQAETNASLNEIQKNQQILILQNEDSKIRSFEKEIEFENQWKGFTETQRSIRNQKVTSGKLR